MSDAQIRKWQRAFDAESSLENLANLNVWKHRSGEELESYLELWFVHLSQPEAYIGLESPDKKIIRYATEVEQRVVELGAVGQAAVSSFSLTSHLRPVTIRYRVSVSYHEREENTLFLKLIFPHHLIGLNNLTVEYRIRDDATMTKYLIQNSETYDPQLPGVVFQQETQNIFDARELPSMIFRDLFLCFRLYEESISNEPLRYIEFFHFIHGSTRNKTIEAIFNKPSFLTNLESVVSRHLISPFLQFPESGVPPLNRVECLIEHRRRQNPPYSLTLVLYYDDIIETDSPPTEFSEGEQWGKPLEVEKTVKQLLDPRLSSVPSWSPTKWYCDAEIEGYDGLGMDVVITCRGKLNLNQLLQLIQQPGIRL
jgi:hypothetical protein